MTSSERRLTYLPKLVDPPGEALPDAVILTRFAHEMGWKESFACGSTAEIFGEFAALTAGTALRLLGREPRAPRADGPLQWPVPASDHAGTPRLYADGRFPTPDGRARLRRGRARGAARGGRRELSAHAHDRPRARPLAHADADRQVAGAGRAHARADPRGESRATRGAPASPGRRVRRDHLSPGQGGGAVPGERGDPRGHVLSAVSLGPAGRILQERQQPDAERPRSGVAAARAEGLRRPTAASLRRRAPRRPRRVGG